MAHCSRFVFLSKETKDMVCEDLCVIGRLYFHLRLNWSFRQLAPASPHKLRHTGATLAKQAGVSLEAISEALTHSDKEITKTYVNTKDIVNQTVGEIAFRNLKN
ncbi:tyrosine-type recombinase/integrase [Streptococcus salivarius]